jgi:hypothetical protein
MALLPSAVAVLSLAALFGGMLAFSAMFAPLVFMKLPAETAGRFVRAIFPWYYLYVLLLGAVAATALAVATERGGAALLAALIAAGAAYARWGLMPAINALRDRQLQGDRSAARGFELRHRLSVAINAVQLLAAGYLLVAVVA